MIDYLKRENKSIHYFGLGFIQIKFENKNIHFYTNKWNTIEDDIHTHKYDFHSKILKGTLKQIIYQEVPGNDYNKTLCDCKAGSENDFLKQTSLKQMIEIDIIKGSTYSIDSKTIHKVESNFCITEVLKGTIGNDKAVIYKPKNMIKDVCPFMNVSENDLWKEVERMIND